MLVKPCIANFSPIHGFGVFALEPINKDEIIWRFDPKVDLVIQFDVAADSLDLEQKIILRRHGYRTRDNEWVLCRDLAMFINHNDVNPNTYSTYEFSKYGETRAATYIPAGVEITENYDEWDLDAPIKLLDGVRYADCSKR